MNSRQSLSFYHLFFYILTIWTMKKKKRVERERERKLKILCTWQPIEVNRLVHTYLSVLLNNKEPAHSFRLKEEKEKQSDICICMHMCVVLWLEKDSIFIIVPHVNTKGKKNIRRLKIDDDMCKQSIRRSVLVWRRCNFFFSSSIYSVQEQGLI